MRAAIRPQAKRAFDVVGAGILLVAASPIFLLVMVALKSADGGSCFFSHVRVGLNGAPFNCLKFRSMVPDAASRLEAVLRADPAARSEWEATRKLRDDPRVTRVGRLLRAMSLDELPQLINVLRGEMSLVGPRPVVQVELVTFYKGAAAAYTSVRPGITGSWQVGGRSDASYEQRVRFDVEYVANLSLRRDLLILMRTPFAVLRRCGAY